MDFCSKILNIDNCSEEAYRTMIYIYHQQGKKSLVARTYNKYKETLKKELEVIPSAKFQSFYDLILKGFEVRY